MRSRKIAGAGLLGAIALMAVQARAVTLYSQNFDPPVPTSSTSQAFGGFGQINNVSGTGWQVQGGGGGGGISVTTGVDTNGVGGTQALFVNNDHSAATSFTFNQYTIYGAVNAPGAGTTPSQVSFDADVFMSGSETSNAPINLILQNNSVDMTFTPTLTNGQFTHVHYTLDQATNTASFDPTMSSNYRVEHGAGGFGFDANNIVRLDNIVIQTVVPEPASLAMLSLAGCSLLRRRR